MDEMLQAMRNLARKLAADGPGRPPKSEAEKQDEEAERLVRPTTKVLPPRTDLQRNTVEPEKATDSGKSARKLPCKDCGRPLPSGIPGRCFSCKRDRLQSQMRWGDEDAKGARVAVQESRNIEVIRNASGEAIKMVPGPTSRSFVGADSVSARKLAGIEAFMDWLYKARSLRTAAFFEGGSIISKQALDQLKTEFVVPAELLEKIAADLDSLGEGVVVGAYDPDTDNYAVVVADDKDATFMKTDVEPDPEAQEEVIEKAASDSDDEDKDACGDESKEADPADDEWQAAFARKRGDGDPVGDEWQGAFARSAAELRKVAAQLRGDIDVDWEGD